MKHLIVLAVVFQKKKQKPKQPGVAGAWLIVSYDSSIHNSFSHMCIL